MSPTGFPEAKTLERFEAGLIDLYSRDGLFVENSAAVEITEGVLYRARRPLPTSVRVGTSRAEHYLISLGTVPEGATRSVRTHTCAVARFSTPKSEQQGLHIVLNEVIVRIVNTTL